jgi:hypothetical protein
LLIAQAHDSQASEALSFLLIAEATEREANRPESPAIHAHPLRFSRVIDEQQVIAR